MKISVLIPGYFPVPEYFALIAASDRVILLDDVSLPRKSYAYRMKICAGNEAEWLSVSLKRGNRSGELIRDKKIDYEINWKKHQLKRMYHVYRRCLYFDEVYPMFEELLAREWKYLFEMDYKIIRTISEGIQIPHDIVKSSGLGIPLNEPDRYVKLIRSAGGETLLVGMELKNFLKEKQITKHGISVDYFDFTHPVYRQENTIKFTPGLSILDALFNCGKQETHFLL
ncbi:WbqC family protein [candidate division KSB1 bacterium]